MEIEEYKKTINLLINQKNILIQSIKEIKNDNISLQGILNNIFFIDNKIKEYYELINNDESNINKDNINNNVLEKLPRKIPRKILTILKIIMIQKKLKI